MIPLSIDMIEGGAHTSDAAIADAVHDYLREHPRAMDSLEGIAQWWLVRQRVRVGVELVARALADLEHRGLLERIGKGGQTMYRLRVPGGVAAGEEVTEPSGDTPVGGGA